MRLKYNYFNLFLVWSTDEGCLRLKQEADLFIYSKCGSQIFPQQLSKGALKTVPSLPLCSLFMVALIFTLPCVTLSLSKNQSLSNEAMTSRTCKYDTSSMATTSNLRKDSHAHLNILIKPNIVSKRFTQVRLYRLYFKSTALINCSIKYI